MTVPSSQDTSSPLASSPPRPSSRPWGLSRGPAQGLVEVWSVTSMRNQLPGPDPIAPRSLPARPGSRHSHAPWSPSHLSPSPASLTPSTLRSPEYHLIHPSSHCRTLTQQSFATAHAPGWGLLQAIPHADTPLPEKPMGLLPSAHGISITSSWKPSLTLLCSPEWVGTSFVLPLHSQLPSLTASLPPVHWGSPESSTGPHSLHSPSDK